MSIFQIIFICCLCSVIVTAIANVIITKNMLKGFFVIVDDHTANITAIYNSKTKEIVDMYEKKISEKDIAIDTIVTAINNGIGK